MAHPNQQGTEDRLNPPNGTRVPTPIPVSLSPLSTILSRTGTLRRAGTQEVTAEDQLGYVSRIEGRVIELSRQWFDPAARISIFVVYFWFGLIKIIGLSSATPLAQALTAKTIGMQYFTASFKTLAFYECGLGILFLIPRLTRLSVVLLVIHLGVVTSPLVIVASRAWTHPLVPTLEGQYIIKDVLLLALAIGILAYRRMPSEGRENIMPAPLGLSDSRSAARSS